MCPLVRPELLGWREPGRAAGVAGRAGAPAVAQATSRIPHIRLRRCVHAPRDRDLHRHQLIRPREHRMQAAGRARLHGPGHDRASEPSLHADSRHRRQSAVARSVPAGACLGMRSGTARGVRARRWLRERRQGQPDHEQGQPLQRRRLGVRQPELPAGGQRGSRPGQWHVPGARAGHRRGDQLSGGPRGRERHRRRPRDDVGSLVGSVPRGSRSDRRFVPAGRGSSPRRCRVHRSARYDVRHHRPDHEPQLRGSDVPQRVRQRSGRVGPRFAGPQRGCRQGDPGVPHRDQGPS